MKRKVLLVASVKIHILSFHIPYLKILKENGFETWVCAKNDIEDEIPYCDNYCDIAFSRQPLAIDNIKAFKALKSIINEEKFDIIHCHTPAAAALTRLGARKTRRKGTKVFYTAHGFHFFKGAPMINWLLYYNIEKFLSGFTDKIFTINKEDYTLAENRFKCEVVYMPGMGVNIDQYAKTVVNKEEKRKELGVDRNTFIILSVGELNFNKNHQIIIKAIAQMGKRDVCYIICGEGAQEKALKNLADELEMGNCLKLLGYRKDIAEICKVSDVFAFPSRREGLGLAAIEAMACGLPLVTSNIHGINDYSVDGKTGYKCGPDDIERFADNLTKLYDSRELCRKMGMYNRALVEKYSIQEAEKKFKKEYGIN